MKGKKIAGLERNVFFTGLTSFFTDTSVKMVYSVMPLFLLSIGASKTSISLIEGIAESTASLLKAFSGYWSDRIRRNKPFMVFGYGLTALVTPFYALAIAPVHVLVLRFVERIGKGIRVAPRDSLIAGSVAKNETGRNFGFHKAMDNSGAIVGPLAAFALLYFFPLNFQNIFLLATIPAVLGMLTIALFIKETRKVGATAYQFKFRQLPKKYYFFLVVIFVFSLGNSTDALLLVRTSETGVKPMFIPFIYMIFNVVSVMIAIPIGRISDRIGREKLLIAGFLVYALVYFMFGAYNDIRVFVFLFALYGLYSALTDSCQKAMISDLTGDEQRGSGYGIYHALLGITLLPASLIAGLLYDKVSASAPFYFGGSMALVATLMMVLFWRRYKV
ncbi:MAG: MFS transporter [Bacteroidales bacterium]|nr:MFS transporter [Bacteroidales bacterium]MDZ4204368.1 MFS transporter [Bacteroidales bacterium]